MYKCIAFISLLKPQHMKIACFMENYVLLLIAKLHLVWNTWCCEKHLTKYAMCVMRKPCLPLWESFSQYFHTFNFRILQKILSHKHWEDSPGMAYLSKFFRQTQYDKPSMPAKWPSSSKSKPSCSLGPHVTCPDCSKKNLRHLQIERLKYGKTNYYDSHYILQ